ncbi:hypothetical protein DXZ75_00175 [Streptomyces sp. AcE210]|nr:hypothetical protein DXZ75_00175 [Streptomyces sp. AcE210]
MGYREAHSLAPRTHQDPDQTHQLGFAADHSTLCHRSETTCVEQGADEPEFTDAEMLPDNRLIPRGPRNGSGFLDRLATVDPLAAAWNWSAQPHTVSF